MTTHDAIPEIMHDTMPDTTDVQALDVQAISRLAQQLAQQAGEQIAQMRNDLTIEFKQGIELVTQADVAADRLITDGIQQAYPDHHIISEELAPDASYTEQPTWIIDPIDGTVNYAHGHSQVAVSIAFYHQGKPLVGVVYNPFQQELFHAIAGKGAWLNHQPIQCAATTELKRALVATGFPYDKSALAPIIDRVQTVLTHCADIRRLGSAALDICWVACGRMDAYYESVKLWDFAAARLIAIEAGAQAGHSWTNDNSSEQPADWQCDHILISNPALFHEMQTLLQQA